MKHLTNQIVDNLFMWEQFAYVDANMVCAGLHEIIVRVDILRYSALTVQHGSPSLCKLVVTFLVCVSCTLSRCSDR